MWYKNSVTGFLKIITIDIEKRLIFYHFKDFNKYEKSHKTLYTSKLKNQKEDFTLPTNHNIHV